MELIRYLCPPPILLSVNGVMKEKPLMDILFVLYVILNGNCVHNITFLTQHFQRARKGGGVLVCKDRGRERWVLLAREAGGHSGGKWCDFGGKCEPGISTNFRIFFFISF